MSLQGGGDFPGLIYDVPTSVTTPAQMLALGQQNANIIGLTTLYACRAGLKRLTLPERKIVIAAQTSSGVAAGFAPMAISGGYAPADEFFWHLDGTQIVMAGTDRNSVTSGIVNVSGINGPCGISGAGSVDFYYPQNISGYVSKIVDSTHIVVTCDQAWAAADIDKILAYDPIYDRWLGRLAYVGSTPIPFSVATGTNAVGGVGTDYLVDLSGSGTVINTAFMNVGQEIVLTTSNGNFLFSGVQCDKFVLPADLRLYQSCNGVFYGQATSLDADFHAEGRMITSAITSRGRFRRRMFGGGGCLFTPSEMMSNIGYTIVGTEDDALDIAGYGPQISAVNSTTSISVAINDCRLPQVGQQVSLLDATRTLQATMTVLTNVAGSSSGATLTFTGAMPSNVAAGWTLQPVTTSRGVYIKPTYRAHLIGSCALRASQQSIRIGDGVHLSSVMGPAVQLSGGGQTEYASMPRVHIGQLHVSNAQSGLGFERTAAVVIHPTNYAGSALAATASWGDVHIDNLVVSGISNGPALSIAGATRAFVTRLTAQGINANPTSYGLGTGYTMSIENTSYAYVGEVLQYEQPGNAIIACAGVTTLVLDERFDGPVPTSGVTNLTAYNKWMSYVPTFTPASGSFTAAPTSGTYAGTAGTSPTVNNGLKYRLTRGKGFEIEGRIDIPANYGTASGFITMTLPFTLGPSAWKGSVFSNEQSRNLWVAEQNPGYANLQLYQQASPGTIAQAALFFEARGETT